MDLYEYQAKELFAAHGVPVLPGKTVETGETWSTGDLLPAGPKTLRKGDLLFSETVGQCKLEEFSGGKARILWTGSTSVESRGRRSEKAVWKVVSIFDTGRGRTESITGSLEITFPEGIRFLSEVSVKSEFGQGTESKGGHR